MEKPADAHLEDTEAGVPDAPGAPGSAVIVPEGYRMVDISPATEKRLLRKIDRVLVTLVFICCGFYVLSILEGFFFLFWLLVLTPDRPARFP